jgi:signal transduction histidine kinase/sensor domain CHASE-containing protein
MTLRKKTPIVIGIILACLIEVLYAASYFISSRSFAELEARDVRQNVQRALSGLNEELAALDALAADLASRDGVYASVQEPDDDYLASTLDEGIFVAQRLNLALLVDASGRRVYATGFDLQAERPVPVPFELDRHLLQGGFLSHAGTRAGLTGIVSLPESAVLLASRPVLAPGEEGPAAGSLILGRYLDIAGLERLGWATGLSLTARRADDPQLPSDFQAALSQGDPLSVRPLGPDSVAGYALVRDVYGEPALVLRANMSREIYRQGLASTRYYLGSLLALGLVFLVVTWVTLERLILSRLARLSNEVSGIGASSDLSTRVSVSGDDELADLAGAINNMLGALERSQDELRESEEALKQRVTEQETLFAIGRLISSRLQIDEVMQMVAEQIARLVDAACCVLSDWDPQTAMLTVRAKYVHPEYVELGPLLNGIGQSCSASERRTAAEAIRSRSPFAAYGDGAWAETNAGWRLQDGRCSGVIGVPIVVLERVIGLVEVYLTQGAQPFAEHDMRLLQSLVDQIAGTINNARLFSVVQANEVALRDLSLQLINAQEQERRRIAQGLHDELGQLLTAIKINLDLARRKLPQGADALDQRVGEASALADLVLNNVRSMTVELRPTLLDDMGIVPTLRWYTRQFTQRTDIPAQLEVPELSDRLQPEIETTIYRLVQEALTNVARHAQAERVEVRLSCANGSVTVSVQDDGAGFDVAGWSVRQAEQPTMGLAGIQKRVMLLGGQVDIESGPGKGTRIRATLPATFREEG